MKDQIIDILKTEVVNTPVVVIGVVLIVAIVAFILYAKNKTLDDIRKDAYQAFLKAEKLFTESGAGVEKMTWVVEKVYALLPTWLRLIVTQSMIELLLQKWFEEIKDLLDDGKNNNSTSSDIEESSDEENEE